MASDQITLPAGTYWVEAQAPAQVAVRSELAELEHLSVGGEATRLVEHCCAHAGSAPHPPTPLGAGPLQDAVEEEFSETKTSPSGQHGHTSESPRIR